MILRYIFQFKQFLFFLKYKLPRSYRNGPGPHSPRFVDFVTKVLCKNEKKNKEFVEIENIRNQLKKDTTFVEIDDFGAGSVKLSSFKRKINDVVRTSSVTPKFGSLLFKITKYSKPDVVIELGTCLGISTMYLASGNCASRVFTIEGSSALLELAEKNFMRLNYTNIFSQQGNFDDILPVILKENSKFDLMYIDGNHRRDAVLRYFRITLPYANDNSIIIIDDIRWSEDMYAAWLELCCNKNVKLSLDLFKMGIIFFDQKLRKQHFKLYY